MAPTHQACQGKGWASYSVLKTTRDPQSLDVKGSSSARASSETALPSTPICPNLATAAHWLSQSNELWAASALGTTGNIFPGSRPRVAALELTAV